MIEIELKKKFVGSWQLQSWTIGYSNSDRLSHPFGESPEGLLLYTPDGRMSASVARHDRDLFPQGKSIKSLPKDIRADAYNSYFHYAGRYHFDGKSVVHKVEMSLNPNFVGTQQVREFEFDDGRLTLRGIDRVGEIDRIHTLVWISAGI